MLDIMPEEHEDYNKLDGYEFPQTLVSNQEEIEKYWSKAIFPNINPLVVALIDFDFQIDEPSWADFILQGTFYFPCILSL